MAFGFWKKLKTGFKKAGSFIRNKVFPAIKEKAIPILKDIGKAAISAGVGALVSGGNPAAAITAGSASVANSIRERVQGVDWSQFKLEPKLK